MSRGFKRRRLAMEGNMQVERILLSKFTGYQRETPEKVEAESKQTLTADAITFAGNKRHQQDKRFDEEEPSQDKENEPKAAQALPALPARASERVKSMLDVLA